MSELREELSILGSNRNVAKSRGCFRYKKVIVIKKKTSSNSESLLSKDQFNCPHGSGFTISTSSVLNATIL